MKKVLLFGDMIISGNVNIFTKNGGLMRIARQLRDRGIEVKQIHNFNSFSIDDINRIIDDFSCHGTEQIIVGISTSFMAGGYYKNHHINNIKFDGEGYWGKELFKKIKLTTYLAKNKYNAMVVMGGWVVNLKNFIKTNDDKLLCPPLSAFIGEVDYFVSGDGSCFISSLSLEEELLKYKPFEYKKDGITLYNIPPIKNFSNQSSTPTIEDHINQKESLITELSAGCIFSCSFCDYGLLGKKKNEFVRSYESIKNEIESNYKNFGTEIYTFTDNIMNDYPPKLEMLVRIRDELGINLRWVGYARLDTIKTDHQIQLLKNSGMIGVFFGIESFTKEVGTAIGKMTDGDRLKDILYRVRDIWKDDVVISAGFITGLPNETMRQIIDTNKFLTSKEGRYLIDTVSYTKLMIYENQNTKNNINISRGNPFSSYKINSPGDWTNEYGTSNQFQILVNSFNLPKRSSSFNLPFYNNMGFDVSEIIRNIRKELDWDRGLSLSGVGNFSQYKSKIDEYKTKVMKGI